MPPVFGRVRTWSSIWASSLVLGAACGHPPAAPTPVANQTEAGTTVAVSVQAIKVEAGDYRQYMIRLQAVDSRGEGLTFGAADVTVSTGAQSITQRFDQPFAGKTSPAKDLYSVDMRIAVPTGSVWGATTVSARVAYVDSAQKSGEIIAAAPVPKCQTSYSMNAPQIVELGQTVGAKIQFYDGCIADGWDLSPSSSTWTSLNPECVTVSVPKLVTVTGVGHCLAAIRATQGGLPVTHMIMSGPLEGPPASLKFRDEAGSLPPGGFENMAVWGTWANGITKFLTDEVEWDSSNPSVASVDAGRVSGLAEGNAIIRASYRGVATSSGVVVSEAPDSLLLGYGPTNGFHVGNSTGLSAMALWAPTPNTRFVQALSTWSTSNPAVATVSSTGVVTAVGVGSVTIIATYHGVSGSRVLTVIP
jgi:uncharacterized protein YjdB